jgi:hypothetical protein
VGGSFLLQFDHHQHHHHHRHRLSAKVLLVLEFLEESCRARAESTLFAECIHAEEEERKTLTHESSSTTRIIIYYFASC